MNPFETSASVLITCKSFNIIMIAWNYLNQSYFRNSKSMYEELKPFYQAEANIIRKFESFYGLLNQKTICHFFES